MVDRLKRLLTGFRKKEKQVLPEYILTKSRFLQYQKCQRLIWFQINHVKLDKKQDMKYSWESDKVRKFARRLFPGSIYQYNTSARDDNINTTLKNLKLGKTIFNASFGADQVYTQIDIMEPVGTMGWNLYEIRNSPTVKKKDCTEELVFQKYLAEKSGLCILNCYVLNIDSTYIKDGEIDPEKIFIKTNLTEDVNKTKSLEFANRLFEMTQSLSLANSHEEFSMLCKTPKSCRAAEICWENSAGGDIFHLREGTEQSIRYYQEGLRFLHEIPLEDELTHRQEIQVKSGKTGEPHVDRENLGKYISTIRYPLYYLDFETINSSIPVYEKSRPFQHVPFQFSLHIQKSPDSELEHYGYIDSGRSDPRREILELLSGLILPGGSIISFEETFEKRCLREAKDVFIEYTDWYNAIIDDFRDLAIPFKSFHYYHPMQKGSTSLKKVVAALTGSGYETMNIQDGYTANFEFLKIKTGVLSIEEREGILENLAEYCKMDTLSLHLVLEKLREIVV